MHILSSETDNCPSWISGRERMTVENISWSVSTKECCRPRRGLNPRPPGLQSDGAFNWATEGGLHFRWVTQYKHVEFCKSCTFQLWWYISSWQEIIQHKAQMLPYCFTIATDLYMLIISRWNKEVLWQLPSHGMCYGKKWNRKQILPFTISLKFTCVLIVRSLNKSDS